MKLVAFVLLLLLPLARCGEPAPPVYRYQRPAVDRVGGVNIPRPRPCPRGWTLVRHNDATVAVWLGAAYGPSGAGWYACRTER